MDETKISDEQLATGKKRYDALCKQILSNKGVLANIMLGCVEEYRFATVEDIVNKYIEGEPSRDVPILETPPTTQIAGNTNEVTSSEEGRTTFDIRFVALIPDKKDNMYLMLGVEAQNNMYPGYPLLKRGSFYCCRMVSSQYGKIFVKSDYGKVRKAVSIWLCPFPPKAQEYTINVYETTERHVMGNYEAKREDYDNTCMIVICLGTKKANELTGLMRLLTVLFLDSLSSEEINTILKDEFSIDVTPDIEKGVAELCNLSEGIMQRVREEGFRDGEVKGRKDGENSFFNAMSLIKNNTPLSDVSKSTGIDISRLQSMRDMMFAH